MGLSDREYTQRSFNSKKRLPRRTGGRSAVVSLIFINLILWLANGLLCPEGDDLTRLLMLQVGTILKVDTIQKVSTIDMFSSYRFLTYGFVHSPADWTHIAFNMVGLLMFGYGLMLGIGPSGFGFVRSDNVENQLGRLEFTALYLLTIILGGIVFALTNFNEPKAGVYGASGGVCGVIILYAWMFPKKTLLLWGILPLPMWVLGILIVITDAFGAAGALGGGIAYTVHLVGAAFGTFYYFVFFKQGMELTGWLDFSSHVKRKPKLKIHTPEDTPSNPPATDEEFNRRLDEILKRYGEVGESGLTSEERDFLQRASRKFADKYRKR